jgi:hypothetical protein
MFKVRENSYKKSWYHYSGNNDTNQKTSNQLVIATATMVAASITIQLCFFDFKNFCKHNLSFKMKYKL